MDRFSQHPRSTSRSRLRPHGVASVSPDPRVSYVELFTDLFETHAGPLLGYFQSRTFSGEVAADLCSETFATALANIDRYDESRGALGAWLWGIGRNLLRRYRETSVVEHRHRQRFTMVLPSLHDDDLDALAARLDAAEFASNISPLLDRLSDSLATAVNLRVVEELSYEEVAARCGCSQGAARVRVSRALALLEQWHDELFDSPDEPLDEHSEAADV